MVLLKNTKPIITKPKIPTDKKILPKVELLKKPSLKILDNHEQKIMKIHNPNISQTKFSVA